MSKADSRPYFRVEKVVSEVRRHYQINGGNVDVQTTYRIISIAGGDIVADCIPSADLAEAMRKGAEEARK